jgi:putative ABC transport system substrate-binding protein
MLEFARSLLVDVKRVGVLYSSSEANDASLVKMLKSDASKLGIEVRAVAVEHSRDIITRINALKDVDFIYLGSSGMIQVSLPAIISSVRRMKIPLINFDKSPVIEGHVLASFGVSHEKVGKKTAKIIDMVLRGKSPAEIPPSYPALNDHESFISEKKLKLYNLSIPAGLKGFNLVKDNEVQK